MSEPDWQYLLSEQVRLNSRLYYLLAYSMLRDDAAAQEVCQQAFQLAWEHRERIDPSVKTLRNWISQTIRTGCLQRIRRKKIERRALASHAAIHPEFVVHPQTGMDLRDAVLAAIALLQEPSRTIVKLRYLDGMSANEIITVVGCSPSELWRQMQSGLEQLRGLLADDWRQDRE